MNPWHAARNILAIRLDNGGDVIMLGPALRAVKDASPQTRLTLLASRAGAAAAPLLPWVDDVITWRPIWQDIHGAAPDDPAYERELIALLAACHFDAALIFTSFSQSPHAPGYVCLLAGIPLRAGESREFGGRVLTTELSGTAKEAHQVERNLRLVEAVGFAAHDRKLAISIPEEARARVPELLAGAGLDPRGPLVVLHPGASAAARRFPAGRFGRVAEIHGENGWPVLVTGVERERPLVDAVLAGAPAAHHLADRTTLAEYAALIERAALVICNNTLPMHLADAAGTALLTLFAGTDLEEQWQPRATRATLMRRPTACHPCYRFTCPIGQPCLDIPADEVAEMALAMLHGESA
jgi:ADP-heptose:LPS heptosyltransferase